MPCSCDRSGMWDRRVKMIENEAKTGIYGFVAIKSAYYSKSRRSHEKSPSMPLERARKNESSGALGSYWASPYNLLEDIAVRDRVQRHDSGEEIKVD
ncbi:hypothetical protein Tco_1312976 [Tanacetum coccineum]